MARPGAMVFVSPTVQCVASAVCCCDSVLLLQCVAVAVCCCCSVLLCVCSCRQRCSVLLLQCVAVCCWCSLLLLKCVAVPVCCYVCVCVSNGAECCCCSVLRCSVSYSLSRSVSSAPPSLARARSCSLFLFSRALS